MTNPSAAPRTTCPRCSTPLSAASALDACPQCGVVFAKLGRTSAREASVRIARTPTQQASLPVWVENYIASMPWAAHPVILAILGLVMCVLAVFFYNDVAAWEAAGARARINVFTLVLYRIGGKPLVPLTFVGIALVPWTAAFYLHRARRR